MAESTGRERTIMIALAISVALLLVDRLFIDPYLSWRSDLHKQAIVNQQMLSDDRAVLEKQRQLQQLQAITLAKLPVDPAAAESQLLHRLHQWERDAGVSNTSFQRMQSREEGGFNVLTYHIIAEGSIVQIAMLMYRLETATILLRLDEVHVVPKRGKDDTLQLQANLATLGKSATSAGMPLASRLDVSSGAQ